MYNILINGTYQTYGPAHLCQIPTLYLPVVLIAIPYMCIYVNTLALVEYDVQRSNLQSFDRQGGE